MARRHTTEPEVAGNDSFLDVTTNIVGILIILVMVVGERAKTMVIDLPPAGPNQELIAAQSEAQSIEADIHRITNQLATVNAELQAKAIERGQLSTLITAVERDLDTYRASLDEKTRAEVEHNTKLSQARAELARLESERDTVLKAAEPKTVEVESFPTPLAMTVDGAEAVMHLKAGRLTVVPIEQLMERLARSFRDIIQNSQGAPEIIDSVGPIEGFRLRYVIQRRDLVQGVAYHLDYVELLALSNTLGEPYAEAMRNASRFRQTLGTLSPQRYTITVLVYPDSFQEFRELRKQLHDMGYTVAAWPLSHGQNIKISADGRRSSAQ